MKQRPASPYRVWQDARIMPRIGRHFRKGDVTRLSHECLELPVGNRRVIDPKAVNCHAMYRGFLGIMPVGTHAERPARNLDHASIRFTGIGQSRLQAPSLLPCSAAEQASNAESIQAYQRTSHPLDLTGAPRFVKPSLERTVKAKYWIPSLTGHGLDPILPLPLGSFRREVKID